MNGSRTAVCVYTADIKIKVQFRAWVSNLWKNFVFPSSTRQSLQLVTVSDSSARRAGTSCIVS
jgi:hypothetical protein